MNHKNGHLQFRYSLVAKDNSDPWKAFHRMFSPDMDNNYGSIGYISLLQWEHVIVVIY